MRNLLIDVGNTNAKFCLADGDSFTELSYKQALETLHSIKSIAVASVADNKQVSSLLKKALEMEISIINAEVAAKSFGIECAYAEYKNLGIDRWLAVLAADTIYPKTNIVIVDAGTAMTIDFLSAEKKHLGGWIIPGLDLMKSSIIEKASKVFCGEKVAKERFGTDTPSAVSNGCLFTCVGAIELAASFLTEKSTTPIKILITGGNGQELSELINQENKRDEHLVFKGLNRFLTDK